VNGVHTFVFVQGSRAASRGKSLCGHQRENTFGHNSGYQWLKNRICSFKKYKYLHVKIASLANVKSYVTVGPIH